MRNRAPNIVAFGSLAALTALYAVYVVDFSGPPIEDAAMLMRYADHVAEGEGIVWNIGEAPVDGATDFLFMMVVALLHSLGLSLEFAVRLLTITSHFATVCLVYAGMRRVQRAGIIPAFLSAAYFAVGPGIYLAATYFGTPFFAFAVALAWLLAQRIILSGRRAIIDYIIFSLVCLTVGLIRPEGVLISVFMVVGIGVAVPFRDFFRLSTVFGAVFLVLGGSYFLWRWYYFGYPLPNPFYKKGGGRLYMGSLEESVQNSFLLLYPFIPAFLLSLRGVRVFRLGIAFLVPIIGSVGMWVLLSSEMNFGARFQYPVLSICVLSWYPLVKSIREDLRLPSLESLSATMRASVVVLSVVLLGFVFHRHISHSRTLTYPQNGLYTIGKMLGEYSDRGYTLATTEAGLLPLYSKWRSIDTWGLNDQWIAHNGIITEEYLDQQRPDIIMWHGYFSPNHPASERHRRWPWHRMVVKLKTYAESQNYTLAAVYGLSPDNTHYYYVRKGIEDHDEIVQRIRAADYAWYQNGSSARNFIEAHETGQATHVQDDTSSDTKRPN